MKNTKWEQPVKFICRNLEPNRELRRHDDEIRDAYVAFKVEESLDILKNTPYEKK